MIIDNVTRFSKEQETGIIQINDTISRLDRATQKMQWQHQILMFIKRSF